PRRRARSPRPGAASGREEVLRKVAISEWRVAAAPSLDPLIPAASGRSTPVFDGHLRESSLGLACAATSGGLNYSPLATPAPPAPLAAPASRRCSRDYASVRSPPR